MRVLRFAGLHFKKFTYCYVSIRARTYVGLCAGGLCVACHGQPTRKDAYSIEDTVTVAFISHCWNLYRQTNIVRIRSLKLLLKDRAIALCAFAGNKAKGGILLQYPIR